MKGTLTDWLFIGLVLTSVLWFIFALKNPSTRRSFQYLLHKKSAVSCGFIFMCFLFIALLDCIHLPYDASYDLSPSVLDQILSPLNVTQERTFSAPLSLRSYIKDVRVTKDHYHTEYEKLTYPSLIKNNKERNQYIVRQFFKSLIISLITLLMLIFMKYLYLKKYKKNLKRPGVFWTFVFTFCITVFITIFLYDISRALHVFGTGKIGQDIFYYSIKSIRTGLVISVLTTLFTLPLALFFGVAAGYYGGWVDDVIQYVYTTLSSIPGVLLITASVLSMQTYISNHPQLFSTLAQQADARLLSLCFILGVTSWTSLCRLLRAEAMRLREIDFVLAAQVLGVSSLKILKRHLLPNVMHIVMITLVLDFSYLILAEALLTYVGVGVSPMTISWGNMINSARLELARDPIVWWPVFAAFTMMFALVLASNIFADAIESAWNPRVREE